MRRVMIGLLALLLALPVVGVSAAGVGKAFPTIIPLPNGFRPEGVVAGRGPVLYVGSLENGAIYRADARTGEGAILVPPQEDRIAVGLAFDRRANRIFVAGGPGGAAYVYDAESGASLAAYSLTAPGSFVNDVIVTRDAAYLTDSFRPVLYRLPLGPGGRLPAADAAETIPLGGDFVFEQGSFNANGIEATANSRFLIVVHAARGELYRVDPATGEATLIDLAGGTVPNGDGLLLIGHTLYVVQNRLNQIAVVRLAGDFTSGKITDTITDPAFRVPTTVAAHGSALYAVNARFGTTPTPDTEYEIVRVRRH